MIAAYPTVLPFIASQQDQTLTARAALLLPANTENRSGDEDREILE